MAVLAFMSNILTGQINADFTTNNFEACNSLQTTFFDQSTSAESIIDWAWDLDGNTSSEQNPGVVFTQPGSYKICLTVTDVSGNSDTECKEDYISVFPNPVVDFTIDNNEGCVPVEVTFSDNSYSDNGEIVSWLWDVGGSAGVISQTIVSDITSSYGIQGSYTTSLTIVDEKGCTTTSSKANAVVASSLSTPDVDIELIPTCDLPWSINFTINNTDPLINYTWDFGNGETFIGPQPPTIMYNSIGVYDITILMESGDCSETFVLSKAIDTNSTASFSYGPEVVCQNEQVSFVDESLSEADVLRWEFGDGSISTETNPSHVYTSPGCYDVSLIRTVGTCTDTVTISCISVLDQPNISYNVTNQFACTLPADIILHAESDKPGDFQWEFSSNGTAVVHDSNDVVTTISEFGSYKAILTFIGEAGCKSVIDSIPVIIAPFEVNLPLIGEAGCAPFSFTLMDSIVSQVSVASYEWTIGNPAIFTSTEMNPSFTIPDTGRYDVQLIAENIYGCIDTVVVEDYVMAGNKPSVYFEADSEEGCLKDSKQFFDLSTGYVDSWEWFFEGSGGSSEQNPIFYFNSVGTYDVALVASHNGCADSLRIEDLITIFEPSSLFTLTYNCEDPYTVAIENNSIGADSLFWTLRLSDTDSLIITDSLFSTYTFPARGKYALSHYSKSFDTGCEHTWTDTVRIVDPIASYAVDTLRGCAPFELQIGNYSQDAFTYEFISDVANIDSIFKDEPTITFNEGGVLNGPMLIITDIHECVDTFQLTDSISVNKLDAQIDFDSIICVPDVAEFMDQSIEVLGNIVSWEWAIDPIGFTSSDQNTSLYIDSVGMYDLYFKVVDDWGCEDSLVMPLAINAIEIIPDFSFDSLGCTWAPIEFSAIGANGSVSTYEWDFGDGKTSIEKNPKHIYELEGLYSVCLTMTDIRGCGKTICKEDIITILDPVAAYTGDPIFATCPPLLTNFEDQSQNVEKYEWDFGDNSGKSLSDSPSHVYTSPGMYDVTLIVESSPVCRDTLFIDDYITVKGPTGSFVAEVGNTCLPIAVNLNAISDGVYKYVWDLGNGILDSVPSLTNTDSISFFYNETGIFTPKLFVTDSVGCTRSFAGDPIVVDDVQIDFTTEYNVLCGPPLTISMENLSEGTTDDVNYTWQVVGPEDHESVEKNPSFDLSTSGLYDVKLIAQYRGCFDTLSIADFMEVADDPEVTFEILTEELCEDVNVQFSNNSTVGYGEFVTWSWDFGDGDSSTMFEPVHQYDGLESHTVTLTGITDKGCESSFSASFDVLPSTVAMVSDDELICIGDQVMLNGTIENLLEGGNYFWEQDATLSCTDCLNPTATPETTTSYILVGVHPNGCESRDTVEVIVIPSPGPELSIETDSLICSGASSVIEVINFNPDYNYEWNTSIMGQDCYTDCEVVNINPTEATTYFVTVYNEFGCFKEDSITVNVESEFVNFLPEITAICEGESTTIGITAGLNPEWSIESNVPCISCPENIVSPSSDETYYVNVESDLGCTYEDSIVVIVVPSGSIDAGDDLEICIGEEVTLHAIGYGDANWSVGNAEGDSNLIDIKVVPEESGYIKLSMTYFECIEDDSLYIEIFEKADISATGDTICPGEMAFLTAEGRADHFYWHAEDEIVETQNLNISPEETTMYTVIADYRTCEPDTTFAEAYVFQPIDYELEEDFYKIYLNDYISISPTFDTLRNYSFEWLPDVGLDCSDCPAPIISELLESVDYSVLVIDEDTGCNKELDIRVRFQNECTRSIFHLPNIFSPNQDGTNDEFRLYTENPDEFISMQIFDRYGNMLFSENDIEKTWDGTYQGQQVVPGVYVYKVNLICPYNRKKYVIFGDVSVVR